MFAPLPLSGSQHFVPAPATFGWMSGESPWCFQQGAANWGHVLGPKHGLGKQVDDHEAEDLFHPD